MKIIIAGCGKVGYTLAEQLLEEKHEITLIDKQSEKLKSISERIDVNGICGNATSYLIQQEAGVKDADLFIAVTNQDEINLLCCLIAKKAGNCHTIARVRNPEYYAEIGFIKEELGLSLAINPELAAASKILHLIQVPSALELDTFAKGKINLVHFTIPSGSCWHNLKLSDAAKYGPNLLICVVERVDHSLIIPNGNTVLYEGDSVSIIIPPYRMNSLFSKLGLTTKVIKNVMIAGGGTIAYYLARQLLSAKISVKIIELNQERSEELSELLPNATIIRGDASNETLLHEEGLHQMDAFVSLTNYDEENIMLSLYAHKVSSAKLITKINKISFENVINEIPIGSIISPKYLTAEYIIQYVRSMQNSVGSNVETVYRLMDNRVEAVEFIVKEESKVTGIPLAKLKTKENVLLCNILRYGKIIIPSGQDMIQVGDSVVIVTTEKGMDDILDILA